MVARSENMEANCLMLLSRVGECGGESRVFRCKTCMKEFSSFQALGGHRAGHKKPVNNEQSSLLSSGSVFMTKKTKKPSSHTCLTCGLEFPLGQALGGHMRKHRNQKETVALFTRSFLPQARFTTLKKSISWKRVACFDLGLDSVDSMINLNLEL